MSGGNAGSNVSEWAVSGGDSPSRPRPTAGPGPGPSAAVRRRLREQAASIREREVERALSRLGARGDLSTTERAAVEAMARAIVDGVLAAPERALRDGGRDAGAARAATVAHLFDLGASPSGSDAASGCGDGTSG